MWCQHYEAPARAKDVSAMVRAKPGGRARLYLPVPTKASGSAVETLLDVESSAECLTYTDVDRFYGTEVVRPRRSVAIQYGRTEVT
jgi:hypothetical protein